MQWRADEAEQRFAELLLAARRDGPQRIEQDGRDAYVVVALGGDHDPVAGPPRLPGGVLAAPEETTMVRAAPDQQ